MITTYKAPCGCETFRTKGTPKDRRDVSALCPEMDAVAKAIWRLQRKLETHTNQAKAQTR
jgi:hypothetical protein